jgi:sugar O-acyltransferase (sialic acid O-acetyltransferase NeuD family)
MAGDLVIFGAWYLSQAIAEAAELSGWRVAGYVDPQPPDHVATLREFPQRATVIVAIGDSSLRARVCSSLIKHRRALATIVHPSAVVSRSATISPGSYFGENVVLRSSAIVGNGVFVNAGAVVSHDCTVGDFVTLGPNAAIAGHVTIGEQTTIGVGASVRPWVNIGRECEIGAGAAVISNIGDGMTAVGVPARPRARSVRPDKQSDWSRNALW